MAGGIVGAAGSSGAVLSPDGTQLVFVATDGGGIARLWLRPLDAFYLQAADGTEGATLPFWSPDSRSVGFFRETELRRIDVGAGRLADDRARCRICLAAPRGAQAT